MERLRKYMPIAAVVLLVLWAVANAERLGSSDEILIRAVLGGAFFLLLLVRRKRPSQELEIPGWVLKALFPIGLLLALVGIIVPLNMVEWVGVMLLVAGGFLWGSPRSFHRDVLLGCLILFWAHPLPTKAFNGLQDMMQYLSVQGAEDVLHAFNVRVWADGIVLRTGFHDFLVPEACSGMRTSVTVLYCVLGVGILLRLRAHTILIFCLLGLLQVLLFNVARISYMVFWAPRMHEEWARTFLHDTLGILLLVCIILIQSEMGGWAAWYNRRRRLKEGIANGELESPESASIVPGSMRRLARILLIALAIAIPIAAAVGVRYRLRDSRRGEILRRVAEGLATTNPQRAATCIREALEYLPDDRGLLVNLSYVDLSLGHYEQALKRLEVLGVDTLKINEQAMRAWALMRLGRIDEAREVVALLPQHASHWPGVAMLRAEFAAMDDQPLVVAENIVYAVQIYAMTPRIRALLPYLAQHEQWEAISAVDTGAPFNNPLQALVTVRAHVLTRNYSAGVKVLKAALDSWPDDMRFQWAVYEFAKRRGGEWVDRFVSRSIQNIQHLDARELAQTAERAIALNRPDIAWRMYLWLQQLDQEDPMLGYLPARYSNGWLLFPKSILQVRTSGGGAVSLRAALSMLEEVEPFGGLVRAIPLYDDVSTGGVERQRELLDMSIRRFEKRMADGSLSVLEQFTFVRALAMADRWDDAHDVLDRIGQTMPRLLTMVLLQQATLSYEQNEWQQCYEILRRYDQAGGSSLMFVEMMRIGCLGAENQAVMAYEHMTHARQQFPGDVRLTRAEAALWMAYGCPEEAFAALSTNPADLNSPAGYDLLRQTGRIRQARVVGESLGIAIPAELSVAQPLRLLPAPQMLTLPEGKGPRAGWIERRRSTASERAEKAQSPFIRDLNALTVRWCDAYRDAADLPSREAWTQIGRDKAEQASALYRAASLAAAVGDRDGAVGYLEEAVKMFPAASPLWRLFVSCARDRDAVLDRARAACPADPALWGLHMVRLVDAGKMDEAEREVRQHLASRDMPTEHFVRVGDYIRRKGHAPLAKEIAESLLSRDPELIPLLVLGVDAGIGTGDIPFSMRCVRLAIENASDPVPFLKILVSLKASTGQVDADLIGALDLLSAKEPEQVAWEEQLGHIYFHTGRMRRSLAAFRSVFDRDASQASQSSMVLAAEAARQENRISEAVRILEAAFERDPERLAVLNNLTYLLAQRQETLGRAGTLLPDLVSRAGENAAVLDTIAFVYTQLGDIQRASDFSSRAVSLVRDGSYEKSEVLLNAARVRLAAGEIDDARSFLEQARQEPSLPVSVDVESRRLMNSIDSP